ncbi:MAG: type II toxin-antitoxin system VapC family toxin [Actinobacteria bacterium]|nr:type II toxin-antitoxin system VapC family toxin [Acidimicrobiia bacterium]MCA1737117.1 type II toxin-antitoxin system VapC family toxin [Actinomycetota bacterium]MDQ3500470.1 type II toxin-antitoxin system VapC family toxin [Actinomycetota bacterium]
MLVVDASCLVEVVIDSPRSEHIRERMAADPDQAAPHVVDVEVFSVIRRFRMLGRIDETAARQAVDDLRLWPGERYGHRLLLERAWELRDSVRGWDAMYLALGEALGATVLTIDQRLGRLTGIDCPVEVLSIG